MPDVTIWTENPVIPRLGAGILITGERVEYPMEDLVQYLLVSLLLPIQPVPRNNAVLPLDWQDSAHYNAVRCGYRPELGI
jgi:hypothetical protein